MPNEKLKWLLQDTLSVIVIIAFSLAPLFV